MSGHSGLDGGICVAVRREQLDGHGVIADYGCRFDGVRCPWCIRSWRAAMDALDEVKQEKELKRREGLLKLPKEAAIT